MFEQITDDKLFLTSDDVRFDERGRLVLLPIKKILCPTDFSDPSYEALKNACELCSHFGATLFLLHVLPAMPRPAWAAPLEVGRELYEADLSE